jgi:hypothetical protein
MQLDLFGFEPLTVTEKQQIKKNILSYYWIIRNLRKWKPNDKIYRATYRRQSCKNGRGCDFCGFKYA